MIRELQSDFEEEISMKDDLMKMPLEKLQVMLTGAQRGTISNINTRTIIKESNPQETFYSLLKDINLESNVRTEERNTIYQLS